MTKLEILEEIKMNKIKTENLLKFSAIYLVVLILAAMMVQPVMADEYDFNYEVMPNEGRTSDIILVWVRCEEYYLHSTEQAVLYIFWDNFPVKTRLPPTTVVSGVYFNAWDVTIQPPAHLALLGKHTIRIWVEYADGTLEQKTYQYRITDGMPPKDFWGDWYESLSVDDRQLLKGEPGVQGVQGVRGQTGAKGEKGDSGAQGEQGTAGQMGIQGIQGVQGANGEAGQVNYVMVGIIVVLSHLVIEIFKKMPTLLTMKDLPEE